MVQSAAQKSVQVSTVLERPEDKADRLGISLVLGLENPVREGIGRIARLDRDPLLEHDRAGIDPFVDLVDRAPGHRFPRFQRASLGRKTRVLRQERRVDVQDPAAPARDEIGRQNPHVPREANEVGTRLLQDPHDLSLLSPAAAGVIPLDGERRQTPRSRPGKPARLTLVRNDGDDPGVRNPARFDRVRDRFEVGSPSREQHRQASHHAESRTDPRARDAADRIASKSAR